MRNLALFSDEHRSKERERGRPGPQSLFAGKVCPYHVARARANVACRRIYGNDQLARTWPVRTDARRPSDPGAVSALIKGNNAISCRALLDGFAVVGCALAALHIANAGPRWQVRAAHPHQHGNRARRRKAKTLLVRRATLRKDLGSVMAHVLQGQLQ